MNGGPGFPTFERSDFSGSPATFLFDIVRLEDRPDIPRAFAHRHNYYHLLWMTEADGTHLLDFESYPVRAHSVFFVSPGQLHAWQSSVRPRGYVVNFSQEFFAQMFPRAEDIAQFPFFHVAGDSPVLYLDEAEHDRLAPLLHEIDAEMRGRAVGRAEIARAYLLILLTRLRRLYPAHVDEVGSPASHALTKRFLLLLEDRYLDAGPVRALADTLHVTERQLGDAVKRTLGKTVTQLVHERTVLEARRLLCNTALAVAEIAFQLNFQDFAYFSRFFKKQTGLTPGEFRKRFGTPSWDKSRSDAAEKSNSLSPPS